MRESLEDITTRIELLRLITNDIFDIQVNHNTTLTPTQRVQIFELLEHLPLHQLAIMYRETAYRDVITRLQLHKPPPQPEE